MRLSRARRTRLGRPPHPPGAGPGSGVSGPRGAAGTPDAPAGASGVGGDRAIPSIDGVRALAAALVFVVHYQAAFGGLLVPAGGRASRAGEYAAAVGAQGVSIFFVLSGFLIYGSLLARPVPLGRYLRRRARRIYPTFLVVFGVYLALSALVPSRSKIPHEGAAAYVLANALLLPGVFPIRPMVTVSWSLSFEVAFYVGIALVVAALRLRAWAPRWRLLLWGAAAGLWAAGGPRVHEAVQSFILFVPGILAAECARLPRARAALLRVPAAAAAALLAAALLAAPLLGGEFGPPRVTLAVVAPQVLSTALLSVAAGLLILCAVSGPARAPLLARPDLRRLGEASYSFYLIHGLVINTLEVASERAGLAAAAGAAGPLVYLLMLPPVYALAAAVAFALFRAVEQPLSLG